MNEQDKMVQDGEKKANPIKLIKPLVRVGGGHCGDPDPVELYASEINNAI